MSAPAIGNLLLNCKFAEMPTSYYPTGLNIIKLGAIPNGSDSLAAFQAALNYPEAGKTVKCLVPDGTYNLPSSPTAGVGKVLWEFGRNVVFTGSGVLPFAPTKTMLSGSPVAPQYPNILSVEGSPSLPLTNIDYAKPAVYIERHTNGANANSCDWGNSKKTAAALTEVLVYGAETGEVNAYAARVFSNTAAPSGAQGLVGISALAQSNAPSGQANRDVWAANLIAASSTGNIPENLVGIEVDIIPSVAMPAIRPGQAGAKNATAYWAQAASGVANSNTAFYASSADVTHGWLYGMVVDAPVYEHLAFLRTTQNAPAAKGVRIETQWQADTGRIIECFAGANEQFRVDGNANEGVWIRVAGSLKLIVPGPAGTGTDPDHRMLQVLN